MPEPCAACPFAGCEGCPADPETRKAAAERIRAELRNVSEESA